MFVKAKKKIHVGFLERPLSIACFKYSLLVARHPYFFIVAPILCTVFLGSGYFYKVHLTDINKLVTPLSGPSVEEKKEAMKFATVYGESSAPSRALSEKGLVILVVVAQDGGSVLRPSHRRATLDLNEFLLQNSMVVVEGVEYSYQNVCQRHNGLCFTNGFLYALDVLYSNPGPFDDTSYPVMSHGVRRFYVGEAVGGVTLDPVSHQILEAKAFRMVYQMRLDEKSKQIGNFLAEKMQKIVQNFDDDLLDVAVYHSNTLSDEMLRNSDGLGLRFLACSLILLIFSQACAATTLKHEGCFYVDWTKSKFYVASTGLLGAAMGILSAMGFLFYCGYPYNGVCDAMPFLVISVRLDNTFLMISAIARTDTSREAHERLSIAMSEAAVSITITVLTDILSFAVGLTTDFLAVQMFSLYAVVAMSTTFIYQLTLVMAVLYLSLETEQSNKHCVLFKCPTVSLNKKSDKSLWIRLFMLGTNSHAVSYTDAKSKNDHVDGNANFQPIKSLATVQGSWISKMVQKYYAPFIMHPTTRTSVFFAYVLYMATAIYGCFSLQQGLEPVKLLLPDSYAVKYYRRMDEYFWKMGTQAQIVFGQAGDLSNSTNRREIMKILQEFASSPHGMGTKSLDAWLLSFERFVVEQDGVPMDLLSPAEFSKNIKFFLSFEENSIFRQDVIFQNSNSSTNDTIVSFRGLVGLKNFSRASGQIETVDQFRALAAKYPQYEISTFHPFWPYVDQFETVLPNTLQEIYSGVGFMILIALFFIPSLMCSLWVALAILSIDIGVSGYMAFWGINLDVISMITIIMSIGFSVDFTAHIAHAFAVSEKCGAVEKTADALGALAWPIFQGALSTVMGVMVLSGTESYVTTAFFRTVFLVIAIGLAHALIFLPVVLSVFCGGWSATTKICQFSLFRCCKKNNSNENNSDDFNLSTISNLNQKPQNSTKIYAAATQL